MNDPMSEGSQIFKFENNVSPFPLALQACGSNSQIHPPRTAEPTTEMNEIQAGSTRSPIIHPIGAMNEIQAGSTRSPIIHPIGAMNENWLTDDLYTCKIKPLSAFGHNLFEDSSLIWLTRSVCGSVQSGAQTGPPPFCSLFFFSSMISQHYIVAFSVLN
jgi:hypothetical protein